MAGAAFSLMNWRAYSPQQFPGGDSYLLSDDMATNVTFLPAISRRRMSKLSKLSLRLAQECAPDYHGYAVFGSQHGELVTTQGLLESIAQGEVVSPAGFSASVHNTAVGLHSISNRNVYPCTSISAGRDTLPACFIEACSLLRNGARQVLLVYADDAVPAPLDTFVIGNNQLRGFGALLTAGDAQQSGTFELVQMESGAADRNIEPLEGLIAFLRQRPETGKMDIAGEMFDWRWQYHE